MTLTEVSNNSVPKKINGEVAAADPPPVTTDVAASCHDQLQAHATAIRTLGKQTIKNIVEIGCRLTEAKRLAGHGNWLSWLECEFGWTEKTAENYINVYKFSGKFENFSNLDLPLSGLYLLAAPSTPEPAKGEVIERAESGEKLPVDEIKRVVEKHRADKSRRQPAHRSTKPCAAADVGALAAHKTDLRSDIGATNGGELERLQARIRELEDQFQREKTRSLGLKSEIADLQEAAAKAQRSVGLFAAWSDGTDAELAAGLAAIGLEAILRVMPTWRTELLVATRSKGSQKSFEA